MSRFSIPLQSGGEDVALNDQLALHAPDEVGAAIRDPDQLGDGLAVLGNDDALRPDLVQQGQALLLELRGADRGHASIL